jgi:hypothetical protein
MKAELQKMTSEDLYYAVPHESDEVGGIVADAVEVYWQVRRCGEPLDNVQIPENFYSKEDVNGDLDSNSRLKFLSLTEVKHLENIFVVYALVFAKVEVHPLHLYKCL